MNNYLITGAAGFIGYHLCQRLLNDQQQVIAFDNLNDYYDPQLKEDRLSELKKSDKFSFIKGDLTGKNQLLEIFSQFKPQIVINLAAQVGVRYSLANPEAYLLSNIIGFNNLLECCRKSSPKHIIFASSSSVYGGNKKIPFSVKDNVDHPLNVYGASKKTNELMAHAYSNLYALPLSGLRFFTVYGPWGRPDMAPFLFSKAILAQKPIKVYNQGELIRDFTYVDDIVEAIVRLIDKPPLATDGGLTKELDAASSFAPYQLFNIGQGKPTKVLDFIKILETKLGKKAKIELAPLNREEMIQTAADCSNLARLIDYQPATSLEVGLERFVNWYREYYRV